jgi:hypothetical protein
MSGCKQKKKKKKRKGGTSFRGVFHTSKSSFYKPATGE